MAQSGFTPISLYYSSTGAAVPSAGNLVAGELALNTNDGKLYYKNSSGVVTLLAGATSGPAGGSTTQVQYNNAGVLAGITGATTNGTALTLTAPVLGTPASGTVTNLTGTASININGTVGATTPAAGAFTTLAASGPYVAITPTVGTSAGAFRVNNNGGSTYFGVDNSAGTDFTTGVAYSSVVYTPTNFSVVISNVVKAAVSSTGLAVTGTLSNTTGANFATSSGNVGIGTTGPGALLQVGSLAETVPATYTGSLKVTGATQASLAGVGGIELPVSGDGYAVKIQAVSATGAALVFGRRGGSATWTESMRIDSAGNVGLGVTPSAWYYTFRAFQFGANGSSVFGRSENNTAAIASNAFVNSSGNFTYINTNTASYFQQLNGAFQWYNAASGTAGDAITFTQAMTLDASGNLLVGTTTALAKFTVQTATGAGGYTQFIRNTAATNAAGTLLYINGQASSNTSYFMIKTDDNTQETMRVRGDGNITNLNNSYGAISDVKLKDNIVDASPKLADLMRVKVRSFNLKTNPDCKHLGVIAQELEDVFPAMIEESSDRDRNNNDLGTTTKSVKYSVFVPMLIKAMQEQQAIITALTTRITALEAK